MTLQTPSSLTLPPPALASPLPVPVPPVHVGSHFDAKRLRAKLQGLLAGVERAGDVLGTLLATAKEKAIYAMLEGPDGAYFPDWTAFVTCPQPWGLGVEAGLVETLVKEHRDPKRRARLVLEGPQLLLTRSAPRKGRQGQGVRGIEYSLQRLRRDRPELLERVAAGELTIQAAAELAGHRPPFSAVLVEPQAIARLVVSRLDDPGQREVVDLIAHPERIPDPGHGKNPHWEAYKARTTPPDVLAQQRTHAKAQKEAQRQAYEEAYRERRRELRAARRTQTGAP